LVLAEEPSYYEHNRSQQISRGVPEAQCHTSKSKHATIATRGDQIRLTNVLAATSHAALAIQREIIRSSAIGEGAHVSAGSGADCTFLPHIGLSERRYAQSLQYRVIFPSSVAAAGRLLGHDLLWSDIHPDVIGPSDNLDPNRPGLGVSDGAETTTQAHAKLRY